MKLAVPETVADNQALLDTYGFINFDFASSGDTSSDDYFLNDEDYDAMQSDQDRRLYTWQPDYVAKPATEGNDWQNCYRTIYICNTVLFNLADKKLTGSEADNVKGQALAFRAAIYLDAAQIWCLAYDAATADQDLGLPLRIDPDTNIPSVRSTLRETYNQILTDLHTAIQLLPDQQIAASRPSKVTALGFLARTYLYMGDYENSLKYGLEALSINKQLMNYNTLDVNASYPIANLNIEVLLPTSIAYSPFLSVNTAKIPAEIYNLYEENDLRKAIFFKINSNGEFLFRGNYGGSSTRKNCIAIDEIYLTVSESYAQLNNPARATFWLNALLETRWKTGTYVPLDIKDNAGLLLKIQEERRKELLFRGLRWADIKRYNKAGAQISLTRTVNGKIYNLPPNDLRFAIAIPEDIIGMTGMPQNPR